MKQDDAVHPERHLALYLTGEHDCSYLEGRRARTLFVDPSATIDTAIYQLLIDLGFRRSGSHVYRPACRGCARCVPVRIAVDDFRPDRSQRRNWSRNASRIVLRERAACFDPAHYVLYRDYLLGRHGDGQMADDASEESYQRFLVEPWGGSSLFLELWLEGTLLGVAVTDRLELGLSAVYTFYDPARSALGLGTFAILAQIELARRLELPYLYLGYWVEGCEKMIYKARFRPLEAWDGRRWERFPRGVALRQG
ncbi:arginyltransferase [Marichromatium bheemlicum]|uniref:Aspartate/glutamate leucyltransferase n=1 Tax=Marichromatium bheemlicum TaxID=365339 RepID=A0ABX1I642_9GAMM|nr:arginyltransferase [Marichromatium bheemlicum]NKN31626.1 arginyltransferase [Marichromatium bheemlicum]